MTDRIAAVGIAASNMVSGTGTLGAVLDRYERLGVDLVELPLYALDAIYNGRVHGPAMRALRAVCADRPFGYTIHAPLVSSFMDVGRIEMQRAVCRAAMDVAVELGADRIVHHAGKTPARRKAEIEAILAFQAGHLREAGEEAAERGVYLCVETLFRDDPTLWTPTPAGLAAHLASVDHPNIRATIDFSHCAQRLDTDGAGLLEELAPLVPLTAHLHVHDSFARIRQGLFRTRCEERMFGMGDLHLPPGDGSLDWEALSRLPYVPGTTLMLETPEHYPGAQERAVAAGRAFAARANGEA